MTFDKAFTAVPGNTHQFNEQNWPERNLTPELRPLMARVSDVYGKNQRSLSSSPKVKYDAFVYPRTLEMFIRCSDLTQMERFSKSDPLCVLFIKRLGQWSEYGRTESISNKLNPRVSFGFTSGIVSWLNHVTSVEIWNLSRTQRKLETHWYTAETFMRSWSIAFWFSP